MSQNKQEGSPALPIKHLTFELPADVTATANPLFRFTTPVGMTPLACRVTPLTEFDRTTGDETYVISVEDDTVKISTDNAAVTTPNKALAHECTFAAGTVIAKDSVVEIIATLGGTTPIIPARSVVVFSYIEG